jgi:hypothetical protein
LRRILCRFVLTFHNESSLPEPSTDVVSVCGGVKLTTGPGGVQVWITQSLMSGSTRIDITPRPFESTLVRASRPPDRQFPVEPLVGVDGYVVPAQLTATFHEPDWQEVVEFKIDCRQDPVLVSESRLPSPEFFEHPQTDALTWRPTRLGKRVSFDSDKMFRLVLANAAMPEHHPSLDQMGCHSDAVFKQLKRRRKVRLSMADVAEFARVWGTLSELESDNARLDKITGYGVQGQALLPLSRSAAHVRLMRGREWGLIFEDL